MENQVQPKPSKSICVFCSSSNRVSNSFKEQAYQLGELIAKRGYALVYGGATGGLMSAVSEGAANWGGEIIGVISTPIIQMGRESTLPTKMIKTVNMAERKTKLKELSDVFVVLPGAFGTLDEMFDVVAASSVGEHNKALICINLDAYYNPLQAMIEQMQKENLLPEIEKTKLYFVENIADCMQLIENI